jgi:hypothetical protein
LQLHISDLTQQPHFQNYIQPGTRNNTIRSRPTTNSGLGRVYDFTRLASKSYPKPNNGDGVGLFKLLYFKHHTCLSVQMNFIERIYYFISQLFQNFR